MLIEKIGIPAMLEQTAEEAAELAFACLKYARYLRGENKVHGRTKDEMINDIAEEVSDINICIDELMNGRVISEESIYKFSSEKLRRMEKRLAEGK